MSKVQIQPLCLHMTISLYILTLTCPQSLGGGELQNKGEGGRVEKKIQAEGPWGKRLEPRTYPQLHATEVVYRQASLSVPIDRLRQFGNSVLFWRKSL